MSDSETLAVYDRKASDYADRVETRGRSAALASFLAQLPLGGSVLDWGCGPGHNAALMRDQGFTVTAVDGTRAFARQAQERYHLNVQVETFDALSTVAVFDGVLASFSLLHARKAAMPGHLAQAHRALRPGGWMFLGLKLGEGEKRDALGRLYAYYTDSEITTLLDAAGFHVTERTFGTSSGLDGALWPWFILLAQRG